MKISIWTGKAYEQWGPDSIDAGGIGGSETAAIHMAFELARLGHEVTMFGDHGPHGGMWWGKEPFSLREKPVFYEDYDKAIADPKLLACDVLVSSRDKTMLRLGPAAKVKVLWTHDIHVGDDWEHEVAVFDRVYCLSEWHKRYFLERYPHAEASKIGVTRNAIDPSRFEPDLAWDDLKAEKRPRFVWSSSLERGIDVMLDMWPAIRGMRPDAELHVYYGVDGMRKLNAEAKNDVGLKVIDFLLERIERMRNVGVHYHDRVGQAELARAHMKALVWAYPTAFLETSCITALEAQAAGAYPVCSALAGLNETVRSGYKISGRNKSTEYQRVFLSAVEDALSFNPTVEKFARSNREWALGRTWTAVAKEWEADFEGLLARK